MQEKCPHCGASLKKYWHRLTPGLVRTLVKIYTHVAVKGENKVHPHTEMDLSTVEHMNMTKLRFHGLIAKYKADGEVERGYWLVTRKGNDFLKGYIEVPSKVQTFRNHITDYSEEEVGIKDVMKSEEYWQKEFEFDLFKPEQIELF